MNFRAGRPLQVRCSLNGRRPPLYRYFVYRKQPSARWLSRLIGWPGYRALDPICQLGIGVASCLAEVDVFE